MTAYTFTLVTDGPSDGWMLTPILEWLLRNNCPSHAITLQYADLPKFFRVPKRLHERIKLALDYYPCDCIFVHRDAEAQPPQSRRTEIQAAIESLGAGMPVHHVCVVPIRMTEAWLLLNEAAIRRAAGNPNGTTSLQLPKVSNLENIPNPKKMLQDTLVNASELTGRRRQAFDLKGGTRKVAGFHDDFSSLRELSAFRALECEVRHVVGTLIGDTHPRR